MTQILVSDILDLIGDFFRQKKKKKIVTVTLSREKFNFKNFIFTFENIFSFLFI